MSKTKKGEMKHKNVKSSETTSSTSSSTTSTSTSNAGSKLPAVKASRKWEMWTNNDTKWFFEALCEHGKDFARIQTYMASKKGISRDLIKNKEQVRHYYYRTWHKIANSLKITNSNVVDKGTQEIYGLINYGEIWKKFNNKFDNKLEQHLQELVQYGHTICKVKGKSVRIKTPVCKALKKIHNIDTSEKSKSNNNNPSLINLPKEVCIELHPASNDDWMKVHSLAQNPRVRTRLPLQKRLSTLIEYLERRWSPARVRDAEFRSLCGTSVTRDNNDDHVISQVFRIRPKNVDDLKNVSLSSANVCCNSQVDLSLSAYLKRLFNNEEFREPKKKQKTNKEKCKEHKSSEGSLKSPEIVKSSSPTEDHEDDKLVNEKSEKSEDEEPIVEAERSLTLLKMLTSMDQQDQDGKENDNEHDEMQVSDEDEEDDDNNDDDHDEVPSPELPVPPANETLAQWLSGMKEQCDQDEHIEEDESEAKMNDNQDQERSQNLMLTQANVNERGKQMQVGKLRLENARKGWTLKEVGSMTVGELYLLFGCSQKIMLEYLWENIVPQSPTGHHSSCKENESLTCSNDKECCIDETKEEQTHDSSNNQIVDCLNNKMETETTSIPHGDLNTSNFDSHSQQDILLKLLFSANICLMKMKKKQSFTHQTQYASSSDASQTHPKKKRIKPTPVFGTVSNKSMGMSCSSMATTSSQLLSTVISNTILNNNDNSNDQFKCANNTLSNVSNCKDQTHNQLHANFAEQQQQQSQSASNKPKVQFIVPTSPAPKAVHKAKNPRNVCSDPAAIQEALRQLQSPKYTKRQRRALPKPVFVSQNKPLLPRRIVPERLDMPAMTMINQTQLNSSSNASSPIYMLQPSSSSPSSLTNSIQLKTYANCLPTTSTTSISHSNNGQQSVITPTFILQPQPRSSPQPFIIKPLMKPVDVNSLIPRNNIPVSIIQTKVNATQLLDPEMSIQENSSPINVGASDEHETNKHLRTITSESQSTASSITPTCNSNNSLVNLNHDHLQLHIDSNVLNRLTTSISDINQPSIITTICNSSNIDSRGIITNHNQNDDAIGRKSPTSSRQPLLSLQPPSPTGISALLEISLPEPPSPAVFSENACSSLSDNQSIAKRPFGSLSSNTACTSVITVNTSLCNNNDHHDPTLPTATTSSSLPSPPSFTRLNKTSCSPVPDAHIQWLNGESNDVSIGTLLNSYESPCKSVSNSGSALNLPQEVSCLVNENSMDLMAKFADLAASIVDSHSKSSSST